ncbi:MAG: ABC transporter ATP-binding protein/permease [Candidatus Kapabacteria bacterium]|jgi:ABC-type multidrug transport system fused ATPase/permease subunit|nr:ABC transporter ATP-binding protein/permease [Candidatus Kapabacteria bacterium]
MLEFASPTKIFNVIRSLQLGYLRRMFAFAFRAYPLLGVCIVIHLSSIIMEALAMQAFIPLSAISAGKPVAGNNFSMQLLTALHLPTTAKYIFLTFIILFSLRIVLQIISEGMLGNITGNKMPASLVSRGLQNVLRNIEIAEIERKSVGHYIQLAGEEAHRAAGIVALTVRCVGLFMLIGMYYVIIVSFSSATALGVIVFLGLTALGSYGILRKIHRWGVMSVEHSRIYNSIFVDAMNGVRSVRAFGAEKYVMERFVENLYPQKRQLFLIDFFTLLGKFIPTLLLIVSFGVFILAGTQLSRSAFDYAFAVTLLIFLMRFFLAIGEALNMTLKGVSDLKAARDISEVIETPEFSVSAAHHDLTEAITSLSIENVSFSHDKITPILHNFSVCFERGKVYAIIGESGAGKSTLLDLILGFHQPDSGKIVINNTHDITEIPLHSLRSHIVMLGQETMIFNDTVAHNITYGYEASMAEIQAAAEMATVDEVINNLPNGYDTVLQYRGTNLSGGQRQRIGIARALLRKPDVFLFDESMSALDQTTKDRLIETIIAANRDKIVIFVSHDPSIREKVDEVIELSKYVANEPLAS